jgi:nitrite reductase/ring-hydroxylating ferredoxin subunit
MAKDLQRLIKVRDDLRTRLRLHELRGEALMKKVDEAITAVQEACPHEDTEETSTYHGGGYDYCAETNYRLRCNTCQKLLKKWTETHHGIYG